MGWYRIPSRYSQLNTGQQAIQGHKATLKDKEHTPPNELLVRAVALKVVSVFVDLACVGRWAASVAFTVFTAIVDVAGGIDIAGNVWDQRHVERIDDVKDRKVAVVFRRVRREGAGSVLKVPWSRGTDQGLRWEWQVAWIFFFGGGQARKSSSEEWLSVKVDCQES